MRIALLSWESKHSIAVGGLAEHVTELASALHGRGHEVHVFTRIGARQSTYDCVEGVHYHRCPAQPHPDFLVENQRMCDSFVWHLAQTESYLNAPFDIVHGHDWLSVRAMVRVKNDHDRHVVMTMHSTEYGRCGNQLWEGPSRRIREIEWEGAYVAECVICVSKSLQKEVQGLYSVPADKMDAIYNGVDVKRFDTKINGGSARRAHTIGARDPFVLFAGRMTWQKGPDLLMEALPDVLEDHPRAKFVFAGDGDLRDGLVHRAAALGVAEATRFVGHRSGRELVNLFKSADVVCVPSRNEPFGIVILEAWSARKPVVTTRNGGPGEFVTHQNTGLTVSDNEKSIGWGVGAVLADKTNGRRMGRNGRREAESRFSWDTVAAATERVYESVLDGRSNQQPQSNTWTEEISGMARQRSAKTQDGEAKTRRIRSRTGTATTKSTSGTGKSTRTTGRSTHTREKSMLAADVTAGFESTEEAIRRRAYEIYLGRGATPGDPVADWVQAEQEIRAGQAKT